MREKSFSIHNRVLGVQINGGNLWQVPVRKDDETGVLFDESTKKLSVYLHPNDKFSTVQDA